MVNILFCLILTFYTLNLFSENKSVNYPEFTKLLKITVGPDDQLDSHYDFNNKLLAFTRRSGMTMHLQVKDLESSEIKDLLTKEADSTHVKFNDKGQVSFTYYKYNSKGDTCWSLLPINFKTLPLDETQIKCVGLSSSKIEIERSHAFWHTFSDLIMLERIDNINYLIRYNILTSERVEMMKSPSLLSTPFGIYNGKFIVFSEVINKVPQIIVMNLNTKEKTFVPTRLLPGISGLLSLSDDEESLIFSQYISDSNHDGTIDGHDNAVIWRLNLKNLKYYFTNLHIGELKLKQITPLNYNCSYPSPHKSLLFVTCAFQGSLDIYQLPIEGVIPDSWDEKTLNDSFITSRSYQERILILNEKKFRSTNAEEVNKFNHSLMSIHLLAEDYPSALFYLNKIKKNEKKSLYEAIELVLQALELEKKEPNHIVSFTFKNSIIDLKKRLSSLGLSDPLHTLALETFHLLLKQPINLNKVSQLIITNNSPLEYWLFFQLIKKRVPQTHDQLATWVSFYKKVLSSKTLNLESKIYYTNDALNFFNQLELAKTKILILDFKTFLTNDIELSALFESELNIINLINTSSEKEKYLSLQAIDKILKQFKNNYFLRKSINVRCLLNFLNHQEFHYLNIIASNWLRDTPKTSTEFSYSRQIVLKTALNQGYGYWENNKTRIASDYFFQSLSLTDDLESHTGYFNTMEELNQQENRRSRIDYLSEHNTIPNGTHWVKLLLLLSEKNSSQYIKNLDLSLEVLSQLSSDLIDPLKYLITGFIYLEKIYYSQVGAEHNIDFVKNSHENLILAADLSRHNPRIQSSAYSNLALLHLWSQNYGESVRFWELRNKLGFQTTPNRREYRSFLWYYSQSLFLNNQVQSASEVIQQIPDDLQTYETIERTAFYFTFAQKWDLSYKNYKKLESHLGSGFEKASEPTRAKIRLSYAFVLFKLKKFTESTEILNKILHQLPDNLLVNQPYRKTPFEPDKIKSLALGFLSQMGGPSDRIRALSSRIDLIKNDLQKLIQAEIQLAELTNFTDRNRSLDLMQSALANCKKFADENGYLGQTVFRTIQNYLIHGLLHRETYTKLNSKTISYLMEKILYSLAKQMNLATPAGLKNQWHLTYLWMLYQKNVLLAEVSPDWKKTLMSSELAKKLTQLDPEGFKDLMTKLEIIETYKTN